MRPGLRRVALTVHVASSVGWIGALAAFLALAVAVMVQQDVQVVRGAITSMRLITWWVIVPVSLVSLLSGVVQSWGTVWGLLRHYWVVFKLVLTVLACGILALYTQTLNQYAEAAMRSDSGLAQLQAPTFIVHASGGLVLLLVATGLAIYKPRGVTARGQRAQAHRAARAPV